MSNEGIPEAPGIYMSFINENRTYSTLVVNTTESNITTVECTGMLQIKKRIFPEGSKRKVIFYGELQLYLYITLCYGTQANVLDTFYTLRIAQFPASKASALTHFPRF